MHEYKGSRTTSPREVYGLGFRVWVYGLQFRVAKRSGISGLRRDQRIKALGRPQRENLERPSEVSGGVGEVLIL